MAEACCTHTNPSYYYRYYCAWSIRIMRKNIAFIYSYPRRAYSMYTQYILCLLMMMKHANNTIPVVVHVARSSGYYYLVVAVSVAPSLLRSIHILEEVGNIPHYGRLEDRPCIVAATLRPSVTPWYVSFVTCLGITKKERYTHDSATGLVRKKIGWLPLTKERPLGRTTLSPPPDPYHHHSLALVASRSRSITSNATYTTVTIIGRVSRSVAPATHRNKMFGQHSKKYRNN